MIKKIIGFTGSLGSGCTTAAKYLEEKKGYEYISISNDVLLPLAKKYGNPFSTRQQKQDFGNLLREDKDKRNEYLKALILIVGSKENKVAIECFRNPIEIDALRDIYPHFYLLALYAPQNHRKKRHAKEKEFEDLDSRDAGENENRFGQQVRKCVTNADIVLDNSYQWEVIEEAEDFFLKLQDYVRLFENPYRGPTEKELIMHLAYSVSHLSKCIQRQVGAVITDENYRVLSTGYNNVPPASETCFDLFSECYRKFKRNTSIPELSFCPFCGTKLEAQFELLDDKSDLKCKNCDKEIIDVICPSKELESCRSLHAEENAILGNPYTVSALYSRDKRMKIFTTTFPCMLCAKKIATAGIKHLIFVEPYPSQESYAILQENDVAIEVFEGIKSLKFNWIFRKRGKYLKNLASQRRNELKKVKGE